MKSFGLWGSPWEASHGASSCCGMVDKCHLLGGFVLLRGAGLWDQAAAWFTMPTLMLSSDGPLVIGVYGGAYFTDNECSICLEMSINKAPALIAIDLFIHYCSLWLENPHHHGLCSNGSRALAKSILHSKTLDLRRRQTSASQSDFTSLLGGEGATVHHFSLPQTRAWCLLLLLLLSAAEWEKNASRSLLSTSIQRWRTKLPLSESASLAIWLATRCVCSLQRCSGAQWLALLNSGDKSSSSCPTALKPPSTKGRALVGLAASPRDAQLLLCCVYKASGFYAALGSVGSCQYNKTSSPFPGRRWNAWAERLTLTWLWSCSRGQDDLPGEPGLWQGSRAGSEAHGFLFGFV